MRGVREQREGREERCLLPTAGEQELGVVEVEQVENKECVVFFYLARVVCCCQGWRFRFF